MGKFYKGRPLFVPECGHILLIKKNKKICSSQVLFMLENGKITEGSVNKLMVQLDRLTIDNWRCYRLYLNLRAAGVVAVP